jgi:NTP pyrophosphatase (non-canonical NTP hydrolase)
MHTLFENEDFDKGLADFTNFWTDLVYSTSVDRVIEEMSELTKILLKERRGQVERNGKLVSQLIKEEMGDVLLCMEFICRMRGVEMEELIELIAAKSRRITKKLHGKKSDGSEPKV